MKKVLFVGVTKYNLEKDTHLRKKFKGLAGGIKPYILAKGRMTLGRKIFGAEFYLLPPGFFFWPLAFCLAFYLCLVKKIDTIVSQSPLLEGLSGTILKRMLKKELIIEIHGDWEERLPALKKVLTFFAKISLRKADKIRGVAHYLILKAKKYAPDKPYFLFPTFTDLDEFLKEEDIRFDNFILFVGRLHKIKGIDYLLEAFEKIKNEFPDFKLILIGEGINQLETRERVELRGKLSLEETKNIMKNCYCLVLPSLSEGLPRVLMEAMALGKPVIGSNVGGIPELIKDGQNGFLFPAGDSDQLAEKLRVLLSNKGLVVAMGGKGREFVEKSFSNEKYIENYIQMINS